MRCLWSRTQYSLQKSQNKFERPAQEMSPRKRAELDLSGRHLASIPPKIWRNPSLRVLNLFRNELNSLPSDIAQLRELRVLIVANNRLRALPEELGALRQLKMLDAGHNRISALPRSFGKLTSISDYLYLHDNRLRTLNDAVFENFIRLRYLN